jgi:hypothetical protein
MAPQGSERANGNKMHIIFLYGLMLLSWGMWPMGLFFFLCAETQYMWFWKCLFSFILIFKIIKGRCIMLQYNVNLKYKFHIQLKKKNLPLSTLYLPNLKILGCIQGNIHIFNGGLMILLWYKTGQSQILMNKARNMSTEEYKFDTLSVTRPREFVVQVELNRPKKLNAMNQAFWR